MSAAGRRGPDRATAAGALGAAAAVALWAVFAWAADRAPGPATSSPAARPPRPAPTPSAPWQPLADLLLARAVDGDALVVVDGAGRSGGMARAVAAAVAAAPGGPRLAFADTLPSTAAAAANRLASPLAAPRVWVAWPRAGAAGAASGSGDPSGRGIAPDDPVRAWLDDHGQPVAALAAVGAGAAAWSVGAWRHPPSLDGGDYPPVVVPEPLGTIELVGWTIAPRPLVAGRGARVRAAWRVGRDGAAAQTIVFRLLDGGRAAAELGALSVGAPDAPAWPAADIAVVDHDLTVPADVAPGAYDVAVDAVEAATGRPVVGGGGRVVGAVLVAAPVAARAGGESRIQSRPMRAR